MAKLLYRPKIDLKEKFRQGQRKSVDKLSLNKESESEQFIKKVLNSPIGEIVKEFYIDNPIVESTRTPYYSKATFKKGVKMLGSATRGTLFKNTEFDHLNRKFSIEEIMDSVMTHKLAMTPDYRPADKKYLRVPLDLFFFNPFAKSIGKSFFLYWMNNDPLPMIKLAVDANPEITKEFIRLCEWGGLGADDMNNIISGIGMFKEVLSGMTISPVFSRIMTPKKQAEILWVILTDVFDSVGKRVMPKNMVSNKFRTWIEQGLLASEYIM